MKLVVLLVLALGLPLTLAHSNLAYPKPTRQQACRVGGERYKQNCPGPCPKVWDRHPSTSRSRPAATWRRGQKVKIRYHKNNHQGGFTRFTLVPVNQANSKWAHSKYAFYYGCWDAKKVRCRNRSKQECGSDEDGIVFEVEVTVPANLPDGDYMFGYVWYGGVKWTLKHSLFGDYWSCSYIRIRGGTPVRGSAAPVWDHKKCLASVDAIGKCPREPCNGKGVRWMFPSKFNNGRRPGAVPRPGGVTQSKQGPPPPPPPKNQNNGKMTPDKMGEMKQEADDKKIERDAHGRPLTNDWIQFVDITANTPKWKRKPGWWWLSPERARMLIQKGEYKP